MAGRFLDAATQVVNNRWDPPLTFPRRHLTMENGGNCRATFRNYRRDSPKRNKLAKKRVTLAEGEAHANELIGKGESARIAQVGLAEAAVTL